MEDRCARFGADARRLLAKHERTALRKIFYRACIVDKNNPPYIDDGLHRHIAIGTRRSPLAHLGSGVRSKAHWKAGVHSPGLHHVPSFSLRVHTSGNDLETYKIC